MVSSPKESKVIFAYFLLDMPFGCFDLTPFRVTSRYLRCCWQLDLVSLIYQLKFDSSEAEGCLEILKWSLVPTLLHSNLAATTCCETEVERCYGN